ncbi:MAG: hypothetical protein DDT40_01112 [candidate division WS2 bacterium]|nr:hypothetical protein [Candidatus Psychracetigena formicireducens]
MKKSTLISLLLLALSLVLPIVLSERPSLIAYLNLIMIYALSAQGLNLLLGYAGQVSLGHAAFMAIGGYTSAILVMQFGFNNIFSIISAILLTGFCGLFVGFPSLRLSGFYLAIATMALGTASADIIKRLSITGGDQGLRNIPPLNIFSYEFVSEIQKYYLLLIILLIVFILVKNLVNSRSGRALRAIRDAELTAETMGINIAYYKVVAFVISSMIAGLSGALYAHTISYLHPVNFGLSFSIELLAMTIVGGLATIWGPLLGVLFWVFLPRIIGVRMEFLATTLFGIMVILSIRFFPRGLSEVIFRLERKLKLYS